MRSRVKLGAITNIAIILTLIFFVTITDRREFFKGGGLFAGNKGSLSGAKFPVLTGVRYEGKSTTLLLFASAHCKHCQASSGFYKKLFQTMEKRRSEVQAAVVFPKADGQYDWVNAYGLPQSVVLVQIDQLQLDISGTPTIVLVDEKGIVKKSWVGQLNFIEEQQLLNLLG